MIHGGFDYAWSEISEDVLSALAKAYENDLGFPIISVGHSLGGAMATVAAAKLRALDYDVDVYSYGAPRIGNDILSDSISEGEGDVYRVTHNWDPIPLVPLATGKYLGGQYDYRHVSPEYWLTGRPANPAQWPAGDVKVCEGGLNLNCNSGIPWIIITQHGNYLGPMNCKRLVPEDSVNGVYVPDHIQQGIGALLSGEEDPALLGLGECFAPHV